MKTFIRIGVDLAKNYFQIHAIEREGAPPLIRKLSRAKFREFFSKIAATRVGMEACGSAHYWARELRAMGHDAVMMAPAYTKPYVKCGKNDALDRVVSVEDYADFARTYAGIGKASAGRLSDGRRQLVHVTIAEDTPPNRHEPRARRDDRDQGCRISSGPAVEYRIKRPDI